MDGPSLNCVLRRAGDADKAVRDVRAQEEFTLYVSPNYVQMCGTLVILQVYGEEEVYVF